MIIAHLPAFSDMPLRSRSAENQTYGSTDEEFTFIAHIVAVVWTAEYGNTQTIMLNRVSVCSDLVTPNDRRDFIQLTPSFRHIRTETETDAAFRWSPTALFLRICPEKLGFRQSSTGVKVLSPPPSSLLLALADVQIGRSWRSHRASHRPYSQEGRLVHHSIMNKTTD